MNICILNLVFILILTLSHAIYKTFKHSFNIDNLMRFDFSNNIYFIIIATLFLSLTASLRSPFGLSQDYTTYEEIFKNSYLSLKELFELYPTNDLGYFMLNKIFYLINQNFVIFIGCLAFFNIFTIIVLYRKKSSMIWLSLLLTLTLGSYYISYNAIRQFIAVDLFIWAIFSIEEKNFKKYSIIMLLTILIHKSAIFLFPLYWILDIDFINKVNIKRILFISFIFILILVNLDKLIGFIQLFVFKNYANNGYGMTGMNIISIIRPLLVILFILYEIKTLDFSKSFNRIAVNSTILWLILSIISLKIFNISRFTYYFIPLSLAILPNCILNENDKKKKYLFLITILVISITYGIFTQISATDRLLIGEIL